MRTARSKAIFVCIALVAAFSVCSGRLIHLQYVEHEQFAALAAEKHVVKIPVFAKRGRIIDANGEVLADNVAVKTVYADASHISTPEAMRKVAGIAARQLQLDESAVFSKLQTGRRYIVLKKEVDQITAHNLEAELGQKKLRGIYFIEDFHRVYPNNAMLAHVIGYLDHEHRGLAGIEKSMDAYLQGHDGYRYTERDRTGREIVLYRGQERPAQNGYTVQTTVQLALQGIIERELAEACDKYKPRGATIILMEPHTGAIMAMASWPTFDANNANNVPPEVTKNHAIFDMYEPGSTFKIVVTSGALEDKMVNDKTLIYCEGGRFSYNNRVLRDHKAAGNLTVHDIIVNSSNIGSAKLALQMGEQRFYEYTRAFGFGEPTGIDLPGEIRGRVNTPFGSDKLAITRVPMGQAVSVTAIQMASALSVIANGGHLMMPQIVSSIYSPDGQRIAHYDPVEVRRVISSGTAQKITAALIDVTRKAATAAQVPGFLVAGKTGTAQKVRPDGKGYMDDHYIVSFNGFMPADDPKFVCYVMVDDAKLPGHMNYGATVAAPIFSKVAEKVARQLDLRPDPVLMAEQLKNASKQERD